MNKKVVDVVWIALLFIGVLVGMYVIVLIA